MVSALFYAASLLDTSGVEEAQELPCVGSFVPLWRELLHIIYYTGHKIPCVGILKASCPKELTLRR